MAPSDDDRSELLDDDALSAEYPPDRPMGVQEYGTTPQEERVDEPLEERVRREEPDDDRGDDRPVVLFDETEDGFGAGEGDDDETGDAILGEAGEAAWSGDDSGPGLGPPPGSLASDRVPLSAEEAAVHVVDVEAQDEVSDEIDEEPGPE